MPEAYQCSSVESWDLKFEDVIFPTALLKWASNFWQDIL